LRGEKAASITTKLWFVLPPSHLVNWIDIPKMMNRIPDLEPYTKRGTFVEAPVAFLRLVFVPKHIMFWSTFVVIKLPHENQKGDHFNNFEIPVRKTIRRMRRNRPNTEKSKKFKFGTKEKSGTTI
jgi:hypothetical protein